jgi:hypothetical protein
VAKITKYAEEELETAFRYLSGYTSPKPIAAQVEELRRHFPHLGQADASLAEPRAPRFAEGYFAIPRWQSLAPTYTEALQLVLDRLEAQRAGAFFNNRSGQTVEARVRPLPESKAAFERLDATQPGMDIQIVAAQFGLRHRGRSVRRAREMFAPDEFALGAYHVGIMLLTHPERLEDFDDLYVDAPGDEFDDAAADNRFGRTLCFCFEHKKLEFGSHWTDRVYDYNGCASAFHLPPHVKAVPEPSPAGLYPDEEVPANSYGSGYDGPVGLDEQVAILQRAFPALGGCNADAARAPLPEFAEGYFAIPRWQAIAPSYNEALQQLIDALTSERRGRFFNYRKGRLGADVLRQHEKTTRTFQALAERQGMPDILVVPAQFGLRHAGRSIRRARDLFAPDEFGLGALDVAAMLLTHPNRLMQNEDLWPDCAGDEYDDKDRPERYGRAPRFIFDGGQEEFGTHWINRPEDTDGSVSAFLGAEDR